jgi:6-phospho-beta-glucosidase
MDAVRAVIAGSPGPERTALAFTDDLDRALEGADFVFCAIRVGGLAGRVADERVALELGVLGQETTGAGGLAYALRTIPVMRRIAERLRAVAPQAYLVNFTNPAGIVTEALRPILGDRVVGICDTPIGLLRRLKRIAGRPVTAFDYVGLNHLGWLRSVSSGGVDLLPDVLAEDSLLAQIEEARLMGFDWVRELAAIPNEYLYYYYYNREAIARIKSAKATRGEQVLAEQTRFYDKAGADPALAAKAWEEAVGSREATYMAEARPPGQEADRLAEDLGGGYQHVALDIMAAIATGSPQTLILNVGNRRGDGKVVEPLPAECVVEVPCLVDAEGFHPLPVAPVEGHMKGLLTSVKAVEQLVVAAAAEKSAHLAWQAFAAHPLVDSVRVGRELLKGYQKAHPELAYLR